MRMRTYSLVLVQTAGLILAGLAHAQGPDHSDNYGARDEVTQGTVLDMPATPASQPGGANTAEPPSQSVQTQPVQTPARGMAKDRVVAAYGEPQTRHAPIGQPPITRWDYAGYRLYFEYDRVLHAVIPNEPKPIEHTEKLTRATH